MVDVMTCPSTSNVLTREMVWYYRCGQVGRHFEYNHTQGLTLQPSDPVDACLDLDSCFLEGVSGGVFGLPSTSSIQASPLGIALTSGPISPANDPLSPVWGNTNLILVSYISIQSLVY